MTRRRGVCYIVTAGDYSAYHVERVFLTQEAADRFCRRENRKRSGYDRLEWEAKPLGNGGRPDAADPDLPAKVDVWTYQGCVWVPQSAVNALVASAVTMRTNYNSSHYPKLWDEFTDELIPEPKRSKVARAYLQPRPKASHTTVLAGEVPEESIEVRDWNWGSIQVIVTSLRSAEHAKKAWADRRAQILAEKEGLV